MKSFYTSIALAVACFMQIVVSAQSNVTFQVDMSQQIVAPAGVHIAGSFQGWNPAATPLVDLGGGIWAVTVPLNEGDQIEYKFINGNAWGADESVPGACNTNGNRGYTVQPGFQTLEPVCFASCAACQVQVNVTFQVDMSQEIVSPQGVYLVGPFNNWDATATQLTDLGSGVHSVTIPLNGNEEVIYKYLNGPSYDIVEGVPGECGVDDGFGGNNRFFTPGASDETIPLHCFGSCEPCSVASNDGCTDPLAQNFDENAIEDDGSCAYLVTFQVDVSNETVDPQGIYLTGGFNGFSPTETPMTNAGNGVWEVTLSLQQGSVVEYKYLNGPDFAGEESVPSECGVDNGFGGFNRSYSVPSGDSVIDLICFNFCTVCGPPQVAITFRVNTELIDVSAEGIHIAGSFQAFNPGASPMLQLGDNLWVFTALFEPGTVVDYKFINGTDWDVSEMVPAACGFDNGFGTFNRSITVQGESLDLPIVCFGFCENCEDVVIEGCTNSNAANYNPIANVDNGSCIYNVTFIVNMGNIGVLPAGVHIGANFQDFQAGDTPMIDSGNGLYSYSIGLPAGYVIEYKYINGNDWSQAESIPLECGVDDGLGGLQRTYIVVDGANVIPVHCFSSCEDCIECNGVEGCIYPTATNYNPDAEIDNASCVFEGCTDATAVNFSPVFSVDDGSCIYPQIFCGEGTVWDTVLQECVDNGFCPADFNNDGLVNAADLSQFLSAFGSACE